VWALYHSFEADASLQRISHAKAQTRKDPQRYLDSLRTVELVAGSWSMKTIMRLVFVAAIIGVIYFATIGRDQFYDLLDFFYEILGAIAGGYLKK
jgi:hypothetical protein